LINKSIPTLRNKNNTNNFLHTRLYLYYYKNLWNTSLSPVVFSPVLVRVSRQPPFERFSNEWVNRYFVRNLTDTSMLILVRWVHFNMEKCSWRMMELRQISISDIMNDFSILISQSFHPLLQVSFMKKLLLARENEII